MLKSGFLRQNGFISFSKFISTAHAQKEQLISSTPKIIALHEQQRRERLTKISGAMMVYLKAIQVKQEILEKERDAYDQGKRHLANIMGFKLETLTQAQIDAAINYLFPSSLFDEKARPLMKPPDEVLPKIRVIDVDQSGWPKHTLFYTLRPKFYGILSDVNRRTLDLVKSYDKRQLLFQRGKISAEEANRGNPLSKAGFRWLTKEELSNKIGNESITDEMYSAFVMALEYIAQLPNASEQKRFLEGYRHSILDDENNQAAPVRIFRIGGMPPLIPEVRIDKQSGKRYAIGFSKVKATRVRAIVKENGTGVLTVDGHHYDVFRDIQAREILLAPMIVTGLLGKVDVDAKIVTGPGGKSVTPRAVRHAISLALTALYPDTLAERLRIAGLLCPDLRKREREKINQPGARAKWIWKKR